MRRALLLVGFLLAAGCLEGQRDGPDAGDAPVAWRSLAHDHDSGIEEPQRAVVADQEVWRATWALHASSANPKGPAPSVDFATERIVVVALGTKGSGCHDVRVENVTRRGDIVVVALARYDGEAPGYACAAVLVQPVHFVAIRDREREVEFTERVVRPPEPWPYTEEDEPPASEPEPLSVRPLARGSFSDIPEDLRTLVRSEAEWSALWSRHAADAPAPSVDFPNESVVAVVERGPSGCFGLRIGNVTYDADGAALLVEVVHERTPPGFACIQALSHVYAFAAIPDRPGEPRFVDAEADPELPDGEPSAGGAEAPPEETAPEEPPAAPYAFRALDRGSSSGIHREAREVLASDEAWRAFWAEHTSNRAYPPAAPPVDFATERVFAALAGDKGNTCWALRVERVEETAENVTVHVVTYAPPPDAICGYAVTQPYHMVTIPLSSKPLVVVEATREGRPPA